MCEKGPCGANFRARLGQIGPKYVNLLVFVYFLETFPLESLEIWFISSLELRLSAPEAQICGQFRVFKWVKIKGFGIFCLKKASSGFISVLLYMLIAATSSDAYNMGPKRPNFWTILGAKISKNSGLWWFSLNAFTGFTSLLLHMLTASTSRGVENMGIWGQIFHVFGHFVKYISLVLHQSWIKCQFELF